MDKYLAFFLFFVFYSFHFFGQEDTVKRAGTIKIAKFKRDSVYIKADMAFFQFQEGVKKNGRQYPVKQCVAPIPNSSGKFDYNRFFNKKVEVEIADLENKTTDTVRIQVKILDNGKAYFKDLTPLFVMNGRAAYFDAKINAYRLDGIHWKCINALREIEDWEPGYVLLEKIDKFKGQTVIKAKKKKVSATGVLTIIFSLEPFVE